MEWGEANITVLKIELKQFKNFANFKISKVLKTLLDGIKNSNFQ